MKKSTGVILVLIIVLLLGVIGVGGYFFIKGNNDTNNAIGELKNEVANLGKNAENTSNNADNADKTNKAVNNTVSNTNQSVTNNTTTTQTTPTESTEDQIKTIYYNYIKANDEKNTDEKLLEFRVDDVKILSDSEKKSILEYDRGQYYKETDTLAEVSYSVKPQNVNSTNWIAGNGIKSGDWIINKTACVCIRNGEVVNSGTSW